MRTALDELLDPGGAGDFFARPDVQFGQFDPARREFNLEHATLLAELSRLIYRRGADEARPHAGQTRRDFLQRIGVRELEFFQPRTRGAVDAQAMLVASGDPPQFAVLAFRGTESLRDWLTNVRIIPTAFERGEVHRGFLGHFERIWDDVAAALAALPCPVFLTGHSLGGALATLAAARWPSAAAAYTFGSPRVGNRGFIESLSVPVFRVVNETDAVAFVPGEELGYRHAGRLVSLGGRKPGVVEWLTTALGDHARVPGGSALLELGRLFDSSPLARLPDLLDHTPVHYVDAMSTATL